MTELFKIEDVSWTVSGKLFVAGFQENEEQTLKISDSVKIIRPDETTVNSQISGIEYFKVPAKTGNRKITCIFLKDISKEEVPIGSIINLIK